MKQVKRIIALVLALVLAAGFLAITPVQDARAVTQAEINSLKNKSSGIKGKINDCQAEVDRLAAQGKKTFAQKELLDEQCSLISDEIANTEEQIAAYNELIEDAQREYEEAVAAEEAQYELMCERIRAMEERGTISYLEILFGASSFPDLLSRLDFIEEVMQFDDTIIESWQKRQQETIEKKNELQGLLEETEQVKLELENQKAELETKRAEAEALMLEIQANQEEYEALLEELEGEQAEIQAQITAKEAEYAEQIRRQQEAAAKAAAAANAKKASGSGKNASGISLAWPVSSRTVTSYFGYRSASATNGVGSTNHRGIDIGGVGYSSTVSAAAGGVVTVASSGRAEGNYVIISHGSGVRTLYLHLSSYCVSVGVSVSQGQKIGVTGSTGNSTGPHLHFGITIDGSYVNPLTYLP